MTQPLPQARQTHRPESADALRALIADHATQDDPAPLLILGAGEHVRPEQRPEAPFDVVDTTALARVLEVDRVSGLIRAEAGITWGALQAEAARAGLSLDRYGLMPAHATLGGLLARARVQPRVLFSGDLRDGCVALTTLSPEPGRYRYLAAPRKASGPDLRYLSIGGQGALGVILDATIVAWPRQPGHLYTIQAATLPDAAEAWMAVEHLGARISWARWQATTRRMMIAAHAPAPLLERLDALAQEQLGDALKIEDDAALRAARHAFEVDHPERRTAPRAEHTVEIVAPMRLAHLSSALLAAAQEIHALDWTAHHVRLLARFKAPAAEVVARPELIGTLAARPLAGDPAAREAPEWARALKAQLDPHDTLATQP